jgi:hypothetical protein
MGNNHDTKKKKKNQPKNKTKKNKHRNTNKLTNKHTNTETQTNKEAKCRTALWVGGGWPELVHCEAELLPCRRHSERRLAREHSGKHSNNKTETKKKQQAMLDSRISIHDNFDTHLCTTSATRQCGHLSRVVVEKRVHIHCALEVSKRHKKRRGVNKANRHNTNSKKTKMAMDGDSSIQ